jgi:hypothetical protein
MDVCSKILGPKGRMFGSKGQYRHDHEDHLIVFNSNICTEDGQKIWYGDLDLTLDEPALLKIAKSLKQKIYVLYEQDARFENENAPKLEKATLVVDAEGSQLSPSLEEYYHKVDGRWVAKPEEPPTEEELKKRKDEQLKLRDSYKEEDFLEPFKISFSRFKGSKKKSPLEKFQYFIADSLRMKTLDPDFIYVTEKDYNKLQGLYEAWVRHRLEGFTEYRISSSVSWGMFNYGPRSFGENSTPKWARKGNIYIKQSSLEKFMERVKELGGDDDDVSHRM